MQNAPEIKGLLSQSERYREKASEFWMRSATAQTKDLRDVYGLMALDFERMADESDRADGTHSGL